MEKVNHRFDKGLSTEFNPIQQPPGTYVNGENIVRDVQGTVKSERGTTLLAEFTEFTNPTIIGECEVEDETIYFIRSDEGSTIAKLDGDNNIQNILHTGSGATETVEKVSFQVVNASLSGSAPGALTVLSDYEYADITFTLTDRNQVTVSIENDTQNPLLLSQSLTGVISSNRLPEAFWPLETIKHQSDAFYTSDHYLNVIAGQGIVGISYDGPTRGYSQFWIDDFTYESEGVPYNTIAEDVLDFNKGNLIDAVARKNYKGEIIIYFIDDGNTPRRINTAEFIDASNFDNKTRLFLNPSLPSIGDVDEIEGGGLGTGLYMFAARLGTVTGNATTFSQISQGFPLVDGSKSGGEREFDGAPPQTPSGKSLKVTVTDIDTSYNYVELAVITYTGIENFVEAHIIGRKSIKADTMTFDYYSENQKTEEVLIEQVVEDSVNYASAKNILQKDNHLFLSNLATEEYAFLDDALQGVANDLIIRYVNTPVIMPNRPLECQTILPNGGAVEDWSSTRDYRDLHSFTLKDSIYTDYVGYKDPKKTFTQRGYQRDEVYSFALVPKYKGGVYGPAYHIPGNSAPGFFCTIVDNASEPDDRLRGWKNGDGTFHHRMPSLAKSPPYATDILGNDYLNILGIKVEGLDIENNPILSKYLEGYVIVRQRRNQPGNGLVVAQGITVPFFDSNNALIPGAFLGKTKVTKKYNIQNSPVETYGPGTSGSYSKYFLLHAPDQEHGVVTDDYLPAMTHIEMVGIRLAKRKCDNRHANGAGAGIDHYGVLYQEIEEISTKSNVNKDHLRSKKELDTSYIRGINAYGDESGQGVTTLPNGQSIKAAGMMNGVVMGMKTGVIPKEDQGYGTNGNYTSWVNLWDDGGAYGPIAYQVVSEYESVEVYNVLANTSNIYGELTNAEYIMVEEFRLSDSPGNEVSMYGGDTFLSTYDYSLGNQLEPAYVSRPNFRANLRITLETRGNYEFRHYEQTVTEGDVQTVGTLPYFPKYKILHDWDPAHAEQILGTWDTDLSKGSPTAYNKQYHFENTLNKYYPKDTFIDSVTEFPNRTVYSIQSIENEQFDAYRTFLINNYHDIPKETGEITTMFEFSNTLYLHTPHALWRSYVNEKAFVNSTAGEIVLGNGGLFPMPSQRIYTEEGGFGGTGVKWGATNTPFGRIFMDDHQKKIFLLGGKGQLKEISGPLMEQFFTDTIVNGSDLYKMGYDPLNKRAIITLDKNADGIGRSISYGFELGSWASFHSYGVDTFSQRDNKLIGTVGGQIAEIGTGISNIYFDRTYPSKLSVVVNPIPDSTKDLLNLKWVQKDKDTIFRKINVSTYNFTTGDIAPIVPQTFAEEQSFLPLGQQHVHLVGEEHRMTIPPDNNPGVIYDDELFRPTIRGKYGIVELEYMPDSFNIPLELNHFSTEYIKIAE